MYSCQHCNYEDTETMVQCDVCNRWSHFECVGVDEGIADVPWSCPVCHKEAVYKREKEVERKEKEIERKEEQLKQQKDEVDNLIHEAKEFIKNEFEAKKLEMVTMAKSSYETQLEVQRMKNDLKKKEDSLILRERKVKEREESSSARDEIAANTVEGGATAAVKISCTNSVLEALPVTESHFMVWDQLLATEQEHMIKFYLGVNSKDLTDYIKECITKTFEDKFILKITFESGSRFKNSNILRCLIESVQRKFERMHYDDKETRRKIIAVFHQFRNTDKKRKKN